MELAYDSKHNSQYLLRRNQTEMEENRSSAILNTEK